MTQFFSFEFFRNVAVPLPYTGVYHVEDNYDNHSLLSFKISVSYIML